MSGTIEPGTQPADVDVAEAAMFHSISTNEFLDSLGPMRTELGPIEYVPQSTRNLGTPSSLRSLGADSAYDASGEFGNGSHRRVRSTSSSTSIPKRPQRLVAVRYFLDRPGYGLHNSAVRMWFEPPKRCTPQQLHDFLKEQGIALDDLLVEVYLDKFQSFMLLRRLNGI